MATRTRRWLPWLLVLAALWGVWRVGGWMFGDGDAARSDRLVNQLWIERLPRDRRDRVFHLALVQQENRRVGAVARASAWQAHIDAFVWQLRGNEISVRFPQTGQRLTGTVRTWTCKGQAPQPFELCLELRRGKDVLRFYSKHDWVIRAGDPAMAAAAADMPAMAGWEAALAAPGEPVGDGADTPGSDEAWRAFGTLSP
jgi:hypothetical protein